MSKILCGNNISYGNESYEYTDIDSRAKWLWLDSEKYPEYLRSPRTVFESSEGCKFCVAEFSRTYKLPAGKGRTAHISIFADTKFRLYMNGSFIGDGPVAAGGDYGNAVKTMPKQLYNHYAVAVPDNAENLDFFVQVYNIAAVMTDYSCGRGGFIFSCDVKGECEPFTAVSDETWLVRVNRSYKNACDLDLTAEPSPYEKPAVVAKTEADKIWRLTFADIPMLRYTEIAPSSVKKENGRITFDFDRIYSAYISLKILPLKGVAPVTALIHSYEGDEPGGVTERVKFAGELNYRGLRMQSFGALMIELDGGNLDDYSISASAHYARYPVNENNEGNFTCNDEMLNKIYRVGKNTLEMCRQTLHLDSPMHQETLGCTGDYAIESLMTHISFGDMRLTRLDLIRTADWLTVNDGMMFHTTYSLIFVGMALDYYMFTADKSLIYELLPAFDSLFGRFRTYRRADGLIDTPPNYMFIDWGELDGFSMHHPPKALGQTALNAFYRGALLAAAELYEIIGDKASSDTFNAEAENHKKAVNRTLFDNEKGIYFDGLNDKCEKNDWQPENPEKRYYTKHSNTLAVLYGFCEGETAREIMRRVVSDEPMTPESPFMQIQPYFMHYVFEALELTDLFGEYGMKLIHLWDAQIIESPKGMKEGWGEFHGDRSHAWGAAPLYQLPMRISGLKITEPGFTKYTLSPRLFGLTWANVTIPTPTGTLTLHLDKDNLT